MPVIEKRLTVARPLRETWEFIGDFVNSAHWDPGVAEASDRTGRPVGVGTIYDLTVIFGGKHLPMTYEVIAYEPPTRVVLKGIGKSVSAVDDIRFSSSPDGGTTIDYTADLRLTGVAKLATPFMSAKFRKLGDDAIEGMRRALESGTK